MAQHLLCSTKRGLKRVHLLNGGAGHVGRAVGVLVKAVRVLAALSRIGATSNFVHGSRQSHVRLHTD